MRTWDDDEEDRLEHLQLAKARGKGAPKKKRSADGESSLLYFWFSWVEGRVGGLVIRCVDLWE